MYHSYRFPNSISQTQKSFLRDPELLMCSSEILFPDFLIFSIFGQKIKCLSELYQTSICFWTSSLVHVRIIIGFL